MRRTGWVLGWVLLLGAGLPLSGPARAQDAGAPCGRDVNGYPLQCSQSDPGARLEAACVASGDVRTCLTYHRNFCELRGMQQSCRLYEMGRNCFGGDADTCKRYAALIRANTACHANGDRAACDWLQRGGY